LRGVRRAGNPDDGGRGCVALPFLVLSLSKGEDRWMSPVGVNLILRQAQDVQPEVRARQRFCAVCGAPAIQMLAVAPPLPFWIASLRSQ
jgi:hypothetical protein